jgi:hypothetical protein
VIHLRRLHVEQCRVESSFRTAALGLLVALLASWWLILAPPALAQAQPPDLATYTLWLREARAAAGRGDRLGLEDAAGRLAATRDVRLPSGATIAVDNGWLAEALRDAEPDMAAIGARLGAILDALALPPSTAPADARDRLAEILSRPPFVQPANDPPPSWLRDLYEWLVRVLEQLFRPVGRAAAGGARPIARRSGSSAWCCCLA